MINRYTILVIEDEKNIASFISKALSIYKYKVINAYSGSEGLSLISSLCPDIILLDLGLPDMDGLEIIKDVRRWSSTPIIVLSARINEKDKVEALELGADDYITKPFGTLELVARIRTSIRHNSQLLTNSTLQTNYNSSGLVIDFNLRKITVNDTEVHLTPIEYKIVSYLAKNSGMVLTYLNIIRNVWGPNMGDDNKILRVNMANIRRKLEPNPAKPKYIFTEISVGYRMLENNL